MTEITTTEITELKFKCPKCKREGFTLRWNERLNKFHCCPCGHSEKPDFYIKKFEKYGDSETKVDLLTASEIIGAGESGSTLRKAKMEGRLDVEEVPHRGKQKGMVTLGELQRYFLSEFHHRNTDKAVRT